MKTGKWIKKWKIKKSNSLSKKADGKIILF